MISGNSSTTSAFSPATQGTGLSPTMQGRRNGKVPKDIQSLESALKSGDLAGAQKAFAAIKSHAPKAQPPTELTPTINKFNAIGKALEANDVAGATAALEAFKSGLKPTSSGRHLKPHNESNQDLVHERGVSVEA